MTSPTEQQQPDLTCTPGLTFMLAVLTGQPEHFAQLDERYLAGDDHLIHIDMATSLVAIAVELIRDRYPDTDSDDVVIRHIQGALALEEASNAVDAAQHTDTQP
jgi:hypothetical protein